MADVLITGGLGQIGLGVAEAAQRKGMTVSLVGRTPLDKKAPVYREILAKTGLTYQALDIYDTALDGELHKLASKHQYWIQAAEPVNQQMPLRQLELQTQYLYALAHKAGYRKGGNDKKRMVRIGSPAPEIWEDREYEAKFGRLGYVEDQPFADKDCEKPVFHVPYFRLKRCLLKLARSAAERDKIAVLTAAPTLVIGPYALGSYKEIWPQILRGDQPFRMIYPVDTMNAVSLSQAADGILQAAEKGEPGHSYQLAGPNMVMGYLFERMRRVKPRKKWQFGLEWPVKLPKAGPEMNSLDQVISFFSRFQGKHDKGIGEHMITSLHILNQIGSRSADKAREHLHFEPGSWGQFEQEFDRMRDWYIRLGELSPA